MKPPTILMLPSWYPTEEDGIAGSFFSEQASLLAGDCKIVVARPSPGRRTRATLVERAKWIDDRIPEIRLEYDLGFINRAYSSACRRGASPGSPMMEAFSGAAETSLGRAKTRLMAALRPAISALGAEIDVVYGLTAQAVGALAAACADALSARLVLAEHAPFPFPGTIVTPDTKKAFEGASAVLAPSYHAGRMILTQGIKCRPRIVGNLVDEEAFHPRRAVPRSRPLGRRWRIISVGANSYFKDYETLVAALEIAASADRLDFEAILVGYGALKGYGADAKKLEAMIQASPIRDRFTLRPVVQRKDMPSQLAEADIYVSASVQETFGVSCLEALACGLPVVATRSGGVEDFVDQACGRLAPPRDPAALAAALSETVSDYHAFDPDDLHERAVSRFGKDAFRRNMLSALRAEG